MIMASGMKSRLGYAKSRRYQMLVIKEAPVQGASFMLKSYCFNV